MLKVDRIGLYGYVVQYILDKDQPRLIKDNGETYKKGDWYPYGHFLYPLHEEDREYLINIWAERISKTLGYNIDKNNVRIKPVYCYFSDDADFELSGDDDYSYLRR